MVMGIRTRRLRPATWQTEDECTHALTSWFRQCTTSVPTNNVNHLPDGLNDVTLSCIESAQVLSRYGCCCL